MVSYSSALMLRCRHCRRVTTLQIQIWTNLASCSVEGCAIVRLLNDARHSAGIEPRMRLSVTGMK